MSVNQDLTMLEKLTLVLSDGNWHSTEELVEKVGHRFSATMHVAIRQHSYRIEKRRNSQKQFEYKLLNIATVVS